MADALSTTQSEETPRLRRLLLLNPRGFCAGVQRAIDAVERALARYGAPVFVRRSIVHNRDVVERLTSLGAVFVQELEDVPEGAIAILSAHGSPRLVMAAGNRRKLRLLDAICPLVAKVHAEIHGWYRAGRHILLIGHPGHPEIVGAAGQVPAGAISVISCPEDVAGLDLPHNSAVAYAVQTTFAVREADAVIAAVKARFADCAAPRSSDICYATTNRQSAVEAIAGECDVLLVVGDTMSSNARRLVEVAVKAGCPNAYLVSGPSDLHKVDLERVHTVGLTAAASTPERAVAAVSAALCRKGFLATELEGIEETIQFKPLSLEPLELLPSVSLAERSDRLRKAIDRILSDAIGSSPARNRRLAQAMHYAAVGVGKRFRAMLVMAVSELVGGLEDQALRVGAAIECVHAQSLIHDDLPCMDDDDLRRGRLTVHREFDEATAVLAGDALLALAFEILADPATHPLGSLRADLVLALARAVGQDGLAGGQMMDLYPPRYPTKQQVFDCESRKTGALIRYAVEAGAMLGHCSDEERARLLRFADVLGLLFQIRDDMLDEVGDAAQVGKALRKDAARGRKSASLVLGLDGAGHETSNLADACREVLEPFGAKASPLRDLARFAANRLH